MATPVRIVKIPSNESGNWTATTSRTINFDVPADLGVVDLDKSYLLLKMEADTNDTLVPDAVRPVALAGGSSALPAYNSSCMVKNSYLHSERAGRLEDHNDCNFLNQALDFYSESGQEKQSQTIYNGAFHWDEYGKPRSIFRELRYLEEADDAFDDYDLATGVDDMTPNLTPEIRIPLKKVAKFADGMKQAPLFAMGDTRLHVELQNNNVKVLHTYADLGETFELNGIRDISGTSDAARSTSTLTAGYYDPKNLSLWGGAPVTLAYSTGDNSGSLVVETLTDKLNWYPSVPNFTRDTGDVTVSGADFTVVAGNATAINGLVLNLSFENPTTDNQYTLTELSVDVCVGSAGLVVGDEFIVTGAVIGGDMTASLTFIVRDHTGIDSTPDPITTYITGLSHDADTGKVTVTWAEPVPSVARGQAGGENMALTLLDVDADPTWTVTEANLVLHQLLLSPQQIEEMQKNINKGVDIPYMVWDREVVNVNANTTALAQQYRLPPQCGNIVILNSNNTDLVGKTNTVTDYRFEINGTQTTDTNVSVREPLYHDRIVETWSNMNKELKNLDERTSLDTTEEDFGEEPAIFPQPVPLMPESSIVDFRATATGMAASNMYVYKQKQRVLKLSGQNAEVQN